MTKIAAPDIFKDLPIQAARNPGSVPRTPGRKPEQDVPSKETPVEQPDEQPEPDLPDEYEDLPDENDPTRPSAAAAKMSELEMLKQRATLMGIKFSNNIGLEFLRAKITAKLEGEVEPTPPAFRELEPPLPIKTDRQEIYEQEMRLVRLRITNLDPKKKDLPGEIFCVANEILGAVKKYIPYGEATDNGYHVPYVIYRQLREREFLNIKTRKDSRGRTVVETSMAREFALEELPQMTQKELERLAAAQAAAGGMTSQF